MTITTATTIITNISVVYCHCSKKKHITNPLLMKVHYDIDRRCCTVMVGARASHMMKYDAT